ncbi:MAG TPA: hypothetical protein VIQ39_06970 [Methyloceanibacter sp.]|jgi:hypothetical protein
MMRMFIAALGLLLVAGAPAYAHNAPAEVKAGVTKALADIGCTVDESYIEIDDGNYEADDVECKDGNCDMTLDKDFKITNKKKEG